MTSNFNNSEHSQFALLRYLQAFMTVLMGKFVRERDTSPRILEHSGDGQRYAGRIIYSAKLSEIHFNSKNHDRQISARRDSPRLSSIMTALRTEPRS